ncbi:hypothetical protein F2Q68_00018269 [Brassica cretica]|uniref:Uncharacterized protein n=1 Tax=Brassica cretica TaxID=69181 RepID=A0A8S9HQE2_BRACR|nr:hypothetical protein F2Q68_00018269 [Brassica cretica]
MTLGRSHIFRPSEQVFNNIVETSLFHFSTDALSDSSSKTESANDVTEVMVSWRDIEKESQSLTNLQAWPVAAVSIPMHRYPKGSCGSLGLNLLSNEHFFTLCLNSMYLSTGPFIFFLFRIETPYRWEEKDESLGKNSNRSFINSWCTSIRLTKGLLEEATGLQQHCGDFSVPFLH